MMNDGQLDDLLNAPLAAVADSGFSARIMARARMERLKERVPFLATTLICAAAMLLFVPLAQITAAIAHVVSLAVAALVLTFTAERALAQR